MVEVNRPAFKAVATREGEWWVLIANVGSREVASQSKRLANAEPMIREAISLALDLAEDSFDVEVYPELPPGVQGPADKALNLRRQHDDIGQELSRATAEAVQLLRDDGFSVRDTADLVGITPGRVSQIEHRRC